MPNASPDEKATLLTHPVSRVRRFMWYAFILLYLGYSLAALLSSRHFVAFLGCNRDLLDGPAMESCLLRVLPWCGPPIWLMFVGSSAAPIVFYVASTVCVFVTMRLLLKKHLSMGKSALLITGAFVCWFISGLFTGVLII